MAPELLPTTYRKRTLTINDMMSADIFSFGLLVHALINLNEPFMIEVVEDQSFAEDFEISDIKVIGECYDNGKYPKFSNQLIKHQMFHWGRLLWVYFECLELVPDKRPTPDDIVRLMEDEDKTIKGQHSHCLSHAGAG